MILLQIWCLLVWFIRWFLNIADLVLIIHVSYIWNFNPHHKCWKSAISLPRQNWIFPLWHLLCTRLCPNMPQIKAIPLCRFLSNLIAQKEVLLRKWISYNYSELNFYLSLLSVYHIISKFFTYTLFFIVSCPFIFAY